jgi:hypothetical protein
MVSNVHKPFIVERREDPLFVINDHPSTSGIYANSSILTYTSIYDTFVSITFIT